MALYEEEYELLDSFDDRNKQRRVMVLYQTMHRKDLIEPEDDENTIYRLTERGIDLVKFLKSLDDTDRNEQETLGSSRAISGSVKQVTREGISSGVQIIKTESTTEDVSTWIQSWIEIFPSTKIEGRYLRTNKHECADRMRWFLKEYEFDKETIFKATKAYIKSQESSQDGHRFTRNSSYFIFKGRTKHDRTSDLATWCQRVLEEGFEEKETFNRDIA
jgi:hypothetical protein